MSDHFRYQGMWTCLFLAPLLLGIAAFRYGVSLGAAFAAILIFGVLATLMCRRFVSSFLAGEREISSPYVDQLSDWYHNSSQRFWAAVVVGLCLTGFGFAQNSPAAVLFGAALINLGSAVAILKKAHGFEEITS